MSRAQVSGAIGRPLQLAYMKESEERDDDSEMCEEEPSEKCEEEPTESHEAFETAEVMDSMRKSEAERQISMNTKMTPGLV